MVMSVDDCMVWMGSIEVILRIVLFGLNKDILFLEKQIYSHILTLNN